ncbi:ATP synthase-coupling factor 6, mitochondrial-like [Ruditapes philippinarum]|uniref:ATP synthase-coupling factor 6, mitochondrial-like n=1 Tax=Ruditapes philippinarum TaxID=129788 RepID=UPI00295BCCD6|nr:ATP synthase-coupling factor 6, mitochondrial-like [Ruditapes philippinarum]
MFISFVSHNKPVHFVFSTKAGLPFGQDKLNLRMMKFPSKICLTVGQCLRHQASRHVSGTAVLAQKADDPIQQLFVDKIREYAQKKKAAGGKLVDASPETTKDFQIEIDRLKNQYKATDQDMTKFPSFNFVDKELERVESQADKGPTDLPL